ncbi:MAG: hypothetical protein K0R93_981 [Anaerosolibacter sp.]|uniref:hypothetical protein n=1 Tax=Anaerosolibacter sp. TaxID=1872527 RepID=UPI002631ACCE|nr:hypothetical protein [Anaerosolibacter sp.]MDF2546083.1 hypothetical protein [Anaerosolibacter sp.]
MDYREIYKRVYAYMSEKVIDEDCGLLCNSHCCRNFTEDGEEIGIYLMPFEYESVYKDTPLEDRFRFEKHTSKHYYIPPKVKYLYYFHCNKEDGCIRDLRPIQCRSYPFEPHLDGNRLSLVVEREQIHQCPLLDKMDGLRKEFVEGIYQGWKLMLEVPGVKELIQYDSDIRKKHKNIRYIMGDFE